MSVQRTFSLLIICVLLFIGKTQGQNLYSKSFDIRTETSRPKFTKLYCDHEGLIWCGTDKGVFTFNGISFIKVQKSDSISNKKVSAIFESRDGVKWIGYENGQLAKIIRNDLSYYNPQEGFPKAAISSFAEDKNGILYFSTKGEGVYCIEKGRMYNINHDDGLTDDYCYSMTILPDNRLCVGTDGGINFITFKNGNKKVSTFNTVQGLPDDIVRVVYLDKKNKLWLGFQEKGICEFDYHNNSISFSPKNISTNQVNQIISVDDALWVNFEGGKLKKYDKYGKVTDITLENGMSINSGDIITDKENNIWLTESIHLIRTSGNKMTFFSNISGTNIKYVHCLLVDQYGALWYSPDRDLSHSYKNQFGEWETETFAIQPKNHQADIVSLYEDKYGFIWIGTLGDGIFRLNPKTGRSKSFSENKNLEESSILCINGQQDKIWVGGFNGVNVYEIKKDGDKESAIIIKDTAASLLSNDYVYSIFIDSSKRVWFGTDEHGVYYLENTNFINLPLNKGTVHSFAEDKEGKIWFCIQDAGLAYYQNSQIKYFSVQDGLSDPSPVSIKAMKNGKILIDHANGLDILDPKRMTITYHSSEENLADINPDLNTISESTDSTIWIGTEKGIIHYDPFSDLKIDQPLLSFKGIRINSSTTSTNQTKFSFDENNLRFDINGLWYSDPQKVTYLFFLQGYSSNWEKTKEQSFVFSKLPPGNYILKVKSSLNNNFGKSPIIAYAFKITPPFWQTWWFKAALSLVIIFALVLIIKRREKRLRNIDLLNKERIEFQFETLKNQVNPHFLFNSFNTLISIIETNSDLAVEYVEKLSEFFRSIVNYRDKNLILIEEELLLLDNYIFIQKKRFGNNLNVVINVSSEVKTNYSIPPLTLQLLAENAIKHNIISKDKPLQIEVYTDELKSLIVSNNINKKITKDTSSGMGLQNITGRYKLLNTENIIIEETADNFKVTLPLINFNTK